MRSFVLASPEPTDLPSAKAEHLPLAFRAEKSGAALQWTFPAGSLRGANWISFDILHLSGDQAGFRLELQEGENGPCFSLTFSALPFALARLRLPLTALDLNAWALYREGALLKRCCYGARTDPARIDRMRLLVERIAEDAITWEMSLPTIGVDEPPLLREPLLPQGPLVDSIGQARLRSWPEKTKGPEEMIARIRDQQTRAGEQSWPAAFSRWGGWREKTFAASGYFRVAHDGQRWWFVDPEGHAYWSSAPDCARMGTPAAIDGLESAIENGPGLLKEFPECLHTVHRPGQGDTLQFDHLRANLTRAFGPDHVDAAWGETIVGLLRKMGFNGFGNWSESATASAHRFPYVHPLKGGFPHTPTLFRDFPDVWHPAWPDDVAAYAQQLLPLRDDPALIGYFLMNEPTWGFAAQCPAEGLLAHAPAGPGREALVAFLRERHPTDQALAGAWKTDITLSAISAGERFPRIPEAALPDLHAFSGRMAEKFFGDLTAACRAVDPHHLNLGVRYYILPPPWLEEAMSLFDVFSMNCYETQIPADALARLHEKIKRPVLIGEWHFGALDAGLPMAGICRVADQHERGVAFRAYLEHAAAQPWCVGAHYFQLYDQPYLGRFDGENWNIGLLDTAHRPHEAMTRVIRACHETLYEVAAGQCPPHPAKPAHRARHFV
ncbi:MAG: hypothetical protein JJT96_12250 [Opitutales bacterium]|nr:hypothetical protein [Opitutales bacterium]